MKQSFFLLAIITLMLGIACQDDETPKKFTVYLDADGDGYGNAQISLVVIKETDGYVEDDTDCDDTNSEVNPGATEVNGDGGLDNNCDGMISVVCADGSVEGAEDCDDGNTTPGDGCDPTCLVEVGYECEGSPSICTAN